MESLSLIFRWSLRAQRSVLYFQNVSQSSQIEMYAIFALFHKMHYLSVLSWTNVTKTMYTLLTASFEKINKLASFPGTKYFCVLSQWIVCESENKYKSELHFHLLLGCFLFETYTGNYYALNYSSTGPSTCSKHFFRLWKYREHFPSPGSSM